MIWLQNLIIIILGFLLSRIFIEEKIHRDFIGIIFRKKENSIIYYISVILFLSYFLSLFFPNTIVVIALIPIVKLITEKLNQPSLNSKISTNLALALIYGSNIGGMGSMIGASSNIYFLGYIELKDIPGKENINFITWLIFGMPLTLILLFISKFVLGIGLKKIKLTNIKQQVRQQTVNNKPSTLLKFFIFMFCNIVLIIILSTLQFIKEPKALFIGMNFIDIIFVLYLGFFIFISMVLPKNKKNLKEFLKNIFNIVQSLLLFPLIFLSELTEEMNERFNKNFGHIFFQNTLKKIFNKSWLFFFQEERKGPKAKNDNAYISFNRILFELPFLGITFMGFAILIIYILLKIGDNPQTSQLDGYIYIFLQDGLQSILSDNISFFALLSVVIFLSIFLTEIISNTTIIILMFSFISLIADKIDISPLYIMLAVTVASTAAFMSPIASPVNAISYASIRGVSLKEMLLKGLLLNLLSATFLISVFYFVSL